MSERSFYKPPKRSSFMMYFGGAVFVIGVILIWGFADKFGIGKDKLLLLSGLALLLFSSASFNRRTEKKLKQQERELEKMRSECGNGDYNNDIFFD